MQGLVLIWVGYVYYLFFLIINLILILNLIYARLAYAYKYYSNLYIIYEYRGS